jgi:hypothetical protein
MGLQLTKGIYCKPTGDIIYCGERRKAFPVRLRTRQGCLLAPLLSTVMLWFLSSAVVQEKKNERKKNKKKGNMEKLERKIYVHTEMC